MPKIRGGSVIRRPSTTGDVGTAGCLVQFAGIPDELYMLTAGHCLVGPQTKQFDRIEEVISSDRPGQQFGLLAGWTTNLGQLPTDAALIRVDPALVDAEIGDLGVPNGVIDRDIEPGESLTIFALGRRHTGTVEELSVNMPIGMRLPDFAESVPVTYVDQIKCTSFSEAGCSGAIALDKDNKVVGMVVAGDGSTFTLVSPIDAVLADPKWGTDLPALQVCSTVPIGAKAPELPALGDIGSVMTAERLRAVCPNIRGDILEAIITDAPQEFAQAGLNSPVRIAHFIAQIATETGGLRRLDENLNYTTAAQLRKIFPALFPTDAAARPFLGHPEMIGNFVYAHKLGNDREGDGFAYRGSGLIQLTGRGNFRDIGNQIGMGADLENDPELARHPDSALRIALGYWTKRNINGVAGGDSDADVVAVTRLVNAALLGLADRQAYFRKALRVFSQPVPAVSRPAAAPAGGGASPTNVVAAGPTPALSGIDWVRLFPTSRAITDLAADFAAKAGNFVNALRDAGATVDISATFRPKERAYLMHWAWEIGVNGFDPDAVPPMPGVTIQWAHPELAHSYLAAQQMVEAYRMVQIASLNSRHTEGLAIDMTISWGGTLSIRRRDGNIANIGGQPRNGSNPQLIAVGAGYGVIKLPSDPPHWSDDGR